MIDLINRLLNPIKTKIFMMISHALVREIENQRIVNGSTIIHPNQRLRIECLSGDHVTEIPRIQEYGLETYPAIDNSGSSSDLGNGYPEAIAVFINGNKDQGFVIKVGDRRYRITNLAEGEVALYTKWNEESGGHNITLKTGQETEMNSVQLDINVANDITIDSSNLTITCSGDIDINCENANIIASDEVNVECKTANVTATDGINLDGGNTGVVTGVVTGACNCHFTGTPHGFVSSNVKSSI